MRREVSWRSDGEANGFQRLLALFGACVRDEVGWKRGRAIGRGAGTFGGLFEPAGGSSTTPLCPSISRVSFPFLSLLREFYLSVGYSQFSSARLRAPARIFVESHRIRFPRILLVDERGGFYSQHFSPSSDARTSSLSRRRNIFSFPRLRCCEIVNSLVRACVSFCTKNVREDTVHKGETAFRDAIARTDSTVC